MPGPLILLIDADVADAIGNWEVDCVETAAGQVELVLTREEEGEEDEDEGALP